MLGGGGPNVSGGEAHAAAAAGGRGNRESGGGGGLDTRLDPDFLCFHYKVRSVAGDQRERSGLGAIKSSCGIERCCCCFGCRAGQTKAADQRPFRRHHCVSTALPSTPCANRSTPAPSRMRMTGQPAARGTRASAPPAAARAWLATAQSHARMQSGCVGLPLAAWAGFWGGRAWGCMSHGA